MRKALSTGWVEDQATANVFEQFLKKLDQLEQRIMKLEKELEELKKTVSSLEEDVDRMGYDLHLALGPR